MEDKFDTLAKALADSVSRREAISRLGGGVASLLLAAVGLERAWADTSCGKVCNAAFSPSAAATKAKNKRCKDTCEKCQENGRGVSCSFFDADGAMGCCTGATPICCGNACSDLSDANHCGACGTPCTSPPHGTAVCNNGTCDFTCVAGTTKIGSQCVPIQLCDLPNMGCDGQSCQSCGCGCCFLTTEGGAACTSPTTVGTRCTASSQCPSGYLCIINDCADGRCIVPCGT